MIEIHDQMGELVRLVGPPQRIVSLVPSQTELLFTLGLGERVAGVTDFCTEPADAVASKPRIGGTKRFQFDRIAALQPDLVLGNKEENYPDGIAWLGERYPVWMSDIYTLADALQMIRAVGQLAAVDAQAAALVQCIRTAFEELPRFPRRRAVYLIWRKPWMGAGGGTFIDAMLDHAGFDNALGERPRYPELTLADIKAAQPDCILLSSEPFPFTGQHVEALQQQLGIRCRLVDAMPFSWYGSRLRDTPAYFRMLRDADAC